MCCLKPIVTASLDTGADQLDLLNAICSGSAGVNAPVVRLPPSPVSSAPPAVLLKLALVDPAYVRSPPGTNAPNDAGVPSVSESVAGTFPPTVPPPVEPIEKCVVPEPTVNTVRPSASPVLTGAPAPTPT